ncbi:MAG: hypothetical protein Q8R36_01120 [bacterium]|nr:hypothetical protein [bacterium]
MEKKRAPHNTSREMRENPIGILALAMVLGASDSIKLQELQGQQSLVESDTLPMDIGRYSDHDEKKILKSWGVKFLGDVEGDHLFQYVELPKGWKKVTTDDSMHSKLVDNEGRERAEIFYKAASYDRRSDMSLSRRFDVSFDYGRFDKEGVGVANVTDGGKKVVYTTEPISATREKRREVSDQAENAAVEWLDKNRPDWRNPGAYWD